MKAKAIMILSLLSIPAGLILAQKQPLLFLIISVTWLVSPVFFTENKPLFNLCLAHSLLFVTLYVRVLASSSAISLNIGDIVSLHLEQALALLVLLPLARHFFSFSMLRLTSRGIVRAVVVGAGIGLPFGVLDYVSGERIVTLPDLGLGWSLVWIISLSVLVGLLEELLFRGVIYLPARNLVGARWGSLFQALLFSAVHYPNPPSALAAALLFAVIMVYILERTGSLVAPSVAHIANNTVWMMLGRTGGWIF